MTTLRSPWAMLAVLLGTIHVPAAAATPDDASRPGAALEPEAAGLRPIAQDVASARARGARFDRVELFKPERTELGSSLAPLRESQRAALASEVEAGVVLNLDSQALAALLRRPPESVSLVVPSKDGDVELQLVRQDIFAAGFSVRTDTGQRVTETGSLHYGGVVKGDAGSLSAISVFGGRGSRREVMGFYSVGGRWYTLGRLQGDNATDAHLAFDEADAKVQHSMDCGTRDHRHDPADPAANLIEELQDLASAEPAVSAAPAAGVPGPGLAATPRCVTIYVETQRDMYQSRGSVQGVRDFVTGIFNQVFVIFRNNGTPASLSEIFVWTTADPYTSTDYVQRLEQFKRHRNGYNGTFAVLMTLASMRSIAATINSYCMSEDWRMCFTELRGQGYTTYPSYNWPVSIVAHELGHLMGSQHTHACAWNGNNTAIDGCAGFVEGSCSLPAPAPQGQGTIMSYCNPNINFQLGFGSQPGARIESRYAAASCIASGCGGCSYSVSPTSASHGASGGNFSLSVGTTSSCSWTARSNDSWISVTSGSSGTGNGTVGYSVSSNTGAARTGTLTVAGTTVTISQAGSSSGCTTYTGTLTHTGDFDWQPSAVYRTTRRGFHTGTLTGPSSADFDLELWRWDTVRRRWVVVATSAGPTSSERVSFDGEAGDYIWKVLSYSGSGSYSFCLSRP